MTSPNGALDDIASLAAQVGFERSGIAPASAIEVSPEVRDMCNADRCRSFGKNWMCPPSLRRAEALSADDRSENGMLCRADGGYTRR